MSVRGGGDADQYCCPRVWCAGYCGWGGVSEVCAQCHATNAAQVPVGVETRGTLVTRVGKTSYTYDKLTETVTRRLSLKPLVKRFSYAGSTGQVTGSSSSDAVGVFL